MILQMFLTMVFGFGVLTLATIALLNTAGHRIYDLQRMNEEVKPGINLVFDYTYGGDTAERLRQEFARLPWWLGTAAILAIVFVGVLYLVADSPPHLDRAESITLHQRPVGIITWATISSYVVGLLVVTATHSRTLFKAMREFERGV